MAAPQIAVHYDLEPEQAILAWVANEDIPVAGMHIL